MTAEEKELQHYFDKLKEKDTAGLITPPFELPEKKTTIIRWYYIVPAAVAASLAVLFLLTTENEVMEESEATMVISLTNEVTPDTDGFIKTDHSISNWTAPTQVLINEFED